MLPYATLQFFGYVLSGIYNDDLSWPPRTKLPENHIKFQLGDQFISLIYTIRHTNPWVSAAVHILAKEVVLAAFLVVIH